MILEIEQPALDIDWFFTDKNNIGFVASAGGKLPQSISKSRKNVEILSSYFRSLAPISNIEINPRLNEIIPDRKIDGRYLSDFIYMAERGLYSFDKTILNDFNDDRYHLVVKPVIGLNVGELLKEISNILSQTLSQDAIGEFFCSSSFD